MFRIFKSILVVLICIWLPLALGCVSDDDDSSTENAPADDDDASPHGDDDMSPNGEDDDDASPVDDDDDDDDDATPGGEMILIPAAEFGMGCHDAADVRCDFQYEVVQVEAFYIDVYETTYQQYQACLEADVCTPPGGKEQRADGDPQKMPALCVSWDNARAYCEWIGKRLPTSAEWELAARGATGGHDYAWGDDWQPLWANWCDGVECDGSVDGYVGAAPVDAFPENVSPYGVRNMTGNMLEWTATPSVEFPGSYEVRGGAYRPANGMGDPENGLITWMKHADPPELSPDHLGVRCARSATEADDRR